VAVVGLPPVTSLDAQIGSSCRPSMATIEESKGLDLNFPPQQSKLPILQKKYFGDLKRHTWACP
jgi:hypothetical protein